MASISIKDLSVNEELTRDELKGLCGGSIELENTLISSYSVSGSGGSYDANFTGGVFVGDAASGLPTGKRQHKPVG